jgi:hypothetical protein
MKIMITSKRLRLFLAFLGMDKWFRLHNLSPRKDLPCNWCKEVTETKLSEIWCIAEPVGQLQRICENCGKGCA